MDLFKFPLTIDEDSGKCEVLQADNALVLPSLIWNTDPNHQKLQRARARAIVESLEIVYNHQNGVVKVEDNFCVPVIESERKMTAKEVFKSRSERMKEYWRKRREKTSSQT